jgi:hypothetical protein
MSERRRIPDPHGSLEPPRRDPPTAVGTLTPPPPPPPFHRRGGRTPARSRLLDLFRRLAVIPLDLADRLVSAIKR